MRSIILWRVITFKTITMKDSSTYYTAQYSKKLYGKYMCKVSRHTKNCYQQTYHLKWIIKVKQCQRFKGVCLIPSRKHHNNILSPHPVSMSGIEYKASSKQSFLTGLYCRETFDFFNPNLRPRFYNKSRHDMPRRPTLDKNSRTLDRRNSL